MVLSTGMHSYAGAWERGKGKMLTCRVCRSTSLTRFESFYECSQCGQRYTLSEGQLKPHRHSKLLLILIFFQLIAVTILFLAIIGSFITYPENKNFDYLSFFCLAGFLISYAIFIIISGNIPSRHSSIRYKPPIYKDQSPVFYWLIVLFLFSFSIYILVKIFMFFYF